METEKPFVIEDHEDLRKLPEEIRYDVDALLVGTIGENPLEVHTSSRYGLPIIGKDVTDGCPGALRVKKFLRQSKFLYIGEIPSFSAPNGPSDFSAIER